MSLFQNIYAQTFPYLVDQTPEYDVSNLTQGFNGEESPAIAAHNNFIPFAPRGKAAPADDDPNTAPDLSAQIAQLGDIGQAAKAGQRYQEPPPQSAPTAQPDFGNAHPYGDTDTSSNPVDPVTGANIARFTPPEATPAVPMDKTMVPIVLSKNAQKIANQPPPFQPDPNASAAQNKLAQLQYEAENPVDKDQGFKGRLREVLSNFLYGLGQTPPGANVKQALLLGGIGAGAGAFNRTWNERRQAEQELPEAMRNVQFQADQAYKAAQTKDVLAKPGDREMESKRKAARDAVNEQYKKDTISLGVTKAQNLREYRNQIVDLKERGADQNDERIKQLEERIKNESKRVDEVVRHDTVTEGQGDKRIQQGDKRLTQGDKRLAQGDKRIEQTGTNKDLDRKLKIQIHTDAMKNGRTSVLSRAQDAYVKEYQKAHRNKMPTQEEIQNHLNNNVIPLLDEETPQP